MPAFTSSGRFLVSCGAFNRHFSLFPASQAVLDALDDEITTYHTGKGTIQLTTERLLSDDLVTRLINIRLEENAAHRRPGSKAGSGLADVQSVEPPAGWGGLGA